MPANSSGYTITKNIRSLTRSFGSVKVFKAYFEASNQSPNLRSELQSSGVTLVDCPHLGKKEVADKMLLGNLSTQSYVSSATDPHTVDMMAYAIDNPAPCTIFVITGDRDFAYAISILGLRLYQVVLIAGPNARPSLTSQTDICFEWVNDVVKCQLGAPNPQAEHKLRPPLQLQRDGAPEPSPVITRLSPCIPVTDIVNSDGAEDNPIDTAQFLPNGATQRAPASTPPSPKTQGKNQDACLQDGDVLSTSPSPGVPPFVLAERRISSAVTIQETPVLTLLPPLPQASTTSSKPTNKSAESTILTPSLPVVGKPTIFPSPTLKDSSSIKPQEDVVESALAENTTRSSELGTEGIHSFSSLTEDTITRPATAPPSIATSTPSMISESVSLKTPVIELPPCELAPPIPVLNELSAQSRVDTTIAKVSEETSGIDRLDGTQTVKEETHSASSPPEGCSANTAVTKINHSPSPLAPFYVSSLFTTPTTYVPPKPIPGTPKAHASNLPTKSSSTTTQRSIPTPTVNQPKAAVIRKPPTGTPPVPVASSTSVANKAYPSAWIPLFGTLQKHNGVLPRNKIASKIVDIYGQDAFRRAGHQKFNSYLESALKAGFVKMAGNDQTLEVRLAEPYAS